MNKKIEELAKQAGMVKYPTGLGTPPENTIWGDRNIKKFADLLLEEVMQTLIITGHPDAVNTLSKHFGYK